MPRRSNDTEIQRLVESSDDFDDDEDREFNDMATGEATETRTSNNNLSLGGKDTLPNNLPVLSESVRHTV